MFLIDDGLARRLEAVEARIAEEYAQKHSELFLAYGATFESIAGGTALNFGIENGCNLAMVSASPGSTSNRNIERQDFRIAYTRAKLLRVF